MRPRAVLTVPGSEECSECGRSRAPGRDVLCPACAFRRAVRLARLTRESAA